MTFVRPTVFRPAANASLFLSCSCDDPRLMTYLEYGVYIDDICDIFYAYQCVKLTDYQIDAWRTSRDTFHVGCLRGKK